jgi:hypothetical protein
VKESPLFARTAGKYLEEKLVIFQHKSFAVCLKTFSPGVRPASTVGNLQINALQTKQKPDCKFPRYAGFVPTKLL